MSKQKRVPILTPAERQELEDALNLHAVPHEGGCWGWNGELCYGSPVVVIPESLRSVIPYARVSARLVGWRVANPNAVQPSHPTRLEGTCEYYRCVNPSHTKYGTVSAPVKAVTAEQWAVGVQREEEYAMSIRRLRGATA